MKMDVPQILGTGTPMSAGQQSGYRNVDGADEPMSYVRRLDEHFADAWWQQIKHRSFELLALKPGHAVLDIGCGTGDDVLAMARLVGPTGRAVGIDASTTMITEARRRAEGSNLPAELIQGDAQHLEFSDGAFDGSRVERVLQHLDTPQDAIAEMVRVVRPGGSVVALEPDYGATILLGPDRRLTEKVVAARCAHFRHGRIGRRLPGLFKMAGLTTTSLTLHTPATTDVTHGNEWALLQKYAAEARAAGALSDEESERWLAEVQQAAMARRYRRAIPLFLICGRKA